MRFQLGAAAAAVLLVASACTGATDEGDPMDGGDDGFETFAEYTWEIPPGEKVFCNSTTLTEDITLDALEALAPPGTHHVIASWGDPDGPFGLPDGTEECGFYDHHFDAWLFESSDKPNRYEFPEGFGHVIPAGQQLRINMHIINATDQTMSGTTGLRIRRIDPDLVDTYATGIFMGKVSLSVPEGESSHTGQCEAPADMTMIGVNPHMHSHATHMTVVAHSSEMGDMTVLDTEFDFDTGMYFRDIDPFVSIKQGDMVDVTCSYNNTSGMILPWGNDGYTAEMCWAFVFMYGAVGPGETLASTACAN